MSRDPNWHVNSYMHRESVLTLSWHLGYDVGLYKSHDIVLCLETQTDMSTDICIDKVYWPWSEI